jgi:hypothetical protein
MKTIDNRDLRQLVEVHDEPLVTLYMPMYNGAETRQNPVRFKNLLRHAEEMLFRRHIDAVEVEQTLSDAYGLLDQPAVWTAETPGLVAFIRRGCTHVWRLPFRCDERCRVGQHHYVLPLLNWFANNVPFYVIAVSQNSVRLFHGTRDKLAPVDVPKLPTSLTSALHYDVREPALQQHSAGAQMPGKEGLVFHGQGGEVDAAHVELVAFCREIDRALADELRLQTDPLVFAGVDYLFPIFRDVATYPFLSTEHVAGNTERMLADELCRLAWPHVAAVVANRYQTALANFWDNVSFGKTSNRFDEIIVAAQSGAVETLFVDAAVERTGDFDPDNLAVRIDAQPVEDGEDLVNLAATLVLRSRGVVEPVPSGNVPGGGAMAATLRYALPSMPPATEAVAQK